MLLWRSLRCPSGARSTSRGGFVVHACLRPCAVRASGAAGSWVRPTEHEHRHCQIGSRRLLVIPVRPSAAAPLFRRVVGDHPVQDLHVPARGAADVDVPRRLPQEQQVLRSAGGVPVARQQPVGRSVPIRLRGAERAAAGDSDGRRTKTGGSGRASNSQEPRRCRSGIAARRVRSS